MAVDTRSHLIERAVAHYEAGEFDSCALVLITVVDGFVNDFEPHRRQGLHAREPDQMAAWDSVVGHHLGLTHALETFLKTKKKRVDEEVVELYRHGIVHGSVVNYNNVVVATKAWNMLFAVADWATASLKAEKPEEPQPTSSKLLARIRSNRDTAARIDAFEPTKLSSKDPGFTDHEIHQCTAAFLDAWQRTNFGGMAEVASRLSMGEASHDELAGKMRARFEPFELLDYEIIEIDHSTPVIAVARGTATVNGRTGSLECRWCREDEMGQPSMDPTTGKWRLVFPSPAVWTQK